MFLKKIKEAIQTACKEEFGHPLAMGLIRLGAPPRPEMGDTAFPCFPLARILKTAPAQIAERLAGRIRPGDAIDRVVSDGGYLNIFYHRKRFIETTLRGILAQKGSCKRSKKGPVETILMEYSSPNTNKPLHLGHLRNNCLGMALANLLEFSGHKVIRANLVNDRGVHICKSMLAYQRWGDGETPESSGMKGDHLAGKYYVLFEKKAKEDPALEEDVQAMLQKWEAGDEETRALWEKMNQWVFDGFRETYDRMGTRFDKWYFESRTYRLGREIVLQGLDKGLFYRRGDGAVEVDLTDQGFDRKVLLRPNGTAVYITQDIGTAKLKYEDTAFDRSIYVVANEQNYHFNVLFKLLSLLGFSWANSCTHFSYGMVDLPEGRMKSREGTVVDADDLLNELKSLAKRAILERHADFEGKKLDQRAEEIGQGALKFFLLKVNPKNNIHFNPQEALNFEGATGPYIQYAHARIQSIARKAGAIDFESVDLSCLGNPEEFVLAKRLYGFPADAYKAAEECNPSRLCEAAWQIAKDFNKFYRGHQVLRADSDELRNARLLLAYCTAGVLKKALALLGITAPDRM